MDGEEGKGALMQLRTYKICGGTVTPTKTLAQATTKRAAKPSPVGTGPPHQKTDPNHETTQGGRPGKEACQ